MLRALPGRINEQDNLPTPTGSKESEQSGVLQVIHPSNEATVWSKHLIVQGRCSPFSLLEDKSMYPVRHYSLPAYPYLTKKILMLQSKLV